MLKVYEVIYFDECSGQVRSNLIKAFDEDDACKRVELMGEFEVIHVEIFRFYEDV